MLLRWGIQHGFVVLPKSVHRERIAQNAAVYDFTLDPAAMVRREGPRGEPGDRPGSDSAP